MPFTPQDPLTTPPPSGPSPLLSLRTVEQLEADSLAAPSDRKEEAARLALAVHIQTSFDLAARHRDTTGVTRRLNECQRQRAGEYDKAMLEAIKKQGGCDTFFNETDIKCELIEANINDVMGPARDKSWGLDPTPIPDLPQDAADAVAQEVIHRALEAQAAAGAPLSPAAIYQLSKKIYDQRLKALSDEARQRADRMAQKIEDELDEGGYAKAFSEFVYNLATYLSAILKAPVVKVVKRHKWQGGKLVVTPEAAPGVKAVSPFDFYPGPNQESVDQGYICELVTWDKADLAAQKGRPGWNDAEIDAALQEESASSYTYYLSGESQRAALENRDTLRNGGQPDASALAVEYHGRAPGSMLIEWGTTSFQDREGKTQIVEPSDYYDVCAILFGRRVVHMRVNLDPLGRRPYYVTSVRKVPGTLWGRAIPELMRDVQDMINSTGRALANNLALASGPQVMIDLDSKDSQTTLELYPWKLWFYHSKNYDGTNGKPVDFYQPDNNAEQLLRVSDFYSNKADDRTGAPRFQQGNSDLGGAGQTLGGLTILANNSDRIRKHYVLNIDLDVTKPLIEAFYLWNLEYLDDEQYGDLKGDCRVSPRGALAQMVREMTNQARQAFLRDTANEYDMAIIGKRGRARVLRSIVDGLDIPADDVIPSDEELMAWSREGLAMQGALPEGAAAGAPEQLPPNQATMETPQ